MNLSEALDAALPEIPKSQISRKRPPMLDPDLIVREDILDGEPTIVIYQRRTTSVYRFPPTQWKLVQLFDGKRSYEEIAEEYSAIICAAVTSDEIRAVAAGFDEANLWYKTPQERNIALNDKLQAERSRRTEKKSGDSFAHIGFSAWDPDRYLTRLDAAIGKYIYSGWFTVAVLFLFVFEAFVFVDKWSLLGHDIPLYFTFSKKSFADLFRFWVILMVIGFFHESSHGLTCKHYGGEVHSMGFMLLYLAPCFYVDVSACWVSATRLQRLATIIAGIWVETIICGIAMLVWTNTPVGEPIHDFAYEIILFTGLAAIVINLNPLIKLDGYYFLTEWIGIPELKERSTAFISGWVQHHIFRLPAEVPIVPRRRVAFFAIYAFVSGCYSYLLLFVVVRFCFNIMAHYLAEWALLPAAALAFVIFRSRLRTFGRFLVSFYQVRKQSALWRVTPLRMAALAVSAILLFVPILHVRVDAYYLVEPSDVQILRAGVAGTVGQVNVREGQWVHKGEPLASLDSLVYATHDAAAQANLALADMRVAGSEVHHHDLGPAIAQQGEAAQMDVAAVIESKSLTINAPFDGVVMTVAPADLAGRNVGQGQELLRVAKVNPPAVRVFVPGPDLNRVHPGDLVAIDTQSAFHPVRLRLAPLDGETFALPEGILHSQQFKGYELPTFYAARIQLARSVADLRPGMVGRAKIFDRRRSIMERMYVSARNLIRSHVW